MISFQGVWKTFHLPGGLRKPILQGLTLDLPKDRQVAIIGRNGVGKSTFLRIVSGVTQPDRGTVQREGRVSWPMGFIGGLHSALTGRQNARFIARVYGIETDMIAGQVQEFAELGNFFDTPINTYSSGMRARLALGISLAVDFDCYLIDEITAVGDAVFRKKANAALTEKLGHAQIFLVSHSEPTLREYCNCALLLDGGDVYYFNELEEGLSAYRELRDA